LAHSRNVYRWAGQILLDASRIRRSSLSFKLQEITWDSGHSVTIACVLPARGRATLGAQLVGGAILSTLGFAFAVPFAAALRALVLELYVDRMAPRFGRTLDPHEWRHLRCDHTWAEPYSSLSCFWELIVEAVVQNHEWWRAS
jgi:hypothetical protein